MSLSLNQKIASNAVTIAQNASDISTINTVTLANISFLDDVDTSTDASVNALQSRVDANASNILINSLAVTALQNDKQESIISSTDLSFASMTLVDGDDTYLVNHAVLSGFEGSISANDKAIGDVNTALETFKKTTIMSFTMESEGVLVAGEYIGSCGVGVQSEAGFGVGIPFSSRLVAYSFYCISADNTPSVQLTLERYASGNYDTPAISLDLDLMAYGAKNIDNTSVNQAMEAGQICAKITSVSDVADEHAKYRLVLYVMNDGVVLVN